MKVEKIGDELEYVEIEKPEMVIVEYLEGSEIWITINQEDGDDIHLRINSNGHPLDMEMVNE